MDHTLLVVLGVVMAGFSIVIMTLKKQNTQLEKACDRWEKLATIDPLTGAKSRLLLFDYLDREIEFVKRTKDEESSLVLYLDLNDFKMVNDRYGHEAGDLVLITLVKTVKLVIRKSDDIFRLGGDEFIVFAKVNSTSGALQLMRKIRAALELVTVESQEKNSISFSASVGGTFIVMTEGSPKELIERADNALYLSKGKKHKEASYVFYQYGEKPVLLT